MEPEVRDATAGAHFFTTPSEEFCAGDRVAWQDSCYFGPYVTPLEELYGDGPFVVTEVQQVPPELQWAVSHVQWVLLEVQGVKLRFSAALVRRA